MLRPLALVAVLALSAAPASSQTVARSARVVTAVPAGAVVVHHGGVRYHVARGVYYRANGRRGYVAVAPPRGLVVRRLPGGAVSFRHRGARYYRANGVVYQRTRRGYVVVRL